MASSAAKDDKDRPGLVTRQVFLDTQAYRANAHDLSSGPFKALAGLIEEDRAFGEYLGNQLADWIVAISAFSFGP